MLLDSKYTIIPQIRFTLTFDDGVRKVVTVKTNDTVSCSYKKDGEKFSITGIVTKIACNFNSSLGAVGTTAYLQIDGSSEYSGQVVYIQPSQVLDMVIISSTDEKENIVCSVDNDDQRICLIRENEVGVFQYSLDGITWRYATGGQGMSAYECAVKLGFEGTEEEWLASLKGKDGEPGPAGALEIYRVFHSIEEAENCRDLIPKGKLVAVVLGADTLLYVRNGSNNAGICPNCDENVRNTDDGEVIPCRGYDYLGYLTVGPTGPKGDPGKDGKDGKSAYQYAVEGGFPGTEEEFMMVLGRSAVAVTNYYMGPCSKPLTDTVIGPIDLRIFGYTDVNTFISKTITRIDISSSTEPEDQTLLFPEPIILRAVPTNNEAAKPNVIIRGQKYVADCIMTKDGVPGVFRRIRYIESYNGETILGDWISSTGQLDYGAKVQYVSYGKFEPFPEQVQSQYRKLRTYDGDTKIDITEGTYISVVYPIDVKKFIENYVDTYMREHASEIIEPIVVRIIDEKIQIPEGYTLTTWIQKLCGDKIGTLPQGINTVVEYVDAKTNDLDARLDNLEPRVAANEGAIETLGNNVDALGLSVNTLNTRVNTVEGNVTAIGNRVTSAEQNIINLQNGKQDKLTAGKNIKIDANNVISCDASAEIGSTFVTTKEVGGIPVGTTIASTTAIADIIKMMLCPSAPPVEEYVYVGVSKEAPTSVSGLTKKGITKSEVIASGYSNRYTANDERFVYAFQKDMGDLISIKDPNGFEQLDGWEKVEVMDGSIPMYLYYTKETLTVTSFKITFIYTD